MPELYIGLMSGTSLDGIDAALIEFRHGQTHLISFEYIPYSDSIKKKVQFLSQTDTPVPLREYGSVDTLLGSLFADASIKLLEKANISGSAIAAIGCHGQTIYHASDTSPAFSLQIGDPNIIAEKTGITTIADFRRRDIAAGGFGAPLVPAFHRAIFNQSFDYNSQNISIINIGGIANITYISGDKTIGFDIGPGNALIDYWAQKNLNKAYDKNGEWAKTGTINPELVASLKKDSYFKLTPPKSTGKEYFSPSWIENKIKRFQYCNKNDIQASLCQLTAETITEAIHQHATETNRTIICGGGMHNEYLVQLIKDKLTHPVTSTAEFGINPDHIEAMAFAWLARQTINNLSGNLIEVTGARTPVILGGIYPGRNGLN